jgi:hypothetical protein
MRGKNEGVLGQAPGTAEGLGGDRCTSNRTSSLLIGAISVQCSHSKHWATSPCLAPLSSTD